MLDQFSRTQLLIGRDGMEKLAKVMRIECRKRRVKKLKVVYSEE